MLDKHERKQIQVPIPGPSEEPDEETWKKHRKLERWLDEAGSVAVAYSGGSDSAFLLKVAHDVLGKRCVGVTAVSASLAREELDDAISVAEEIGAPHAMVQSHELEDPRYRENSSIRCFFCKNDVFMRIQEFAKERGFSIVIDGSNYDDIGDHRPGIRAARERGVRSPLMELKITKADLRALSRALGLSTWDKAAAPCLSSRIPYGTEVTTGVLDSIERGEAMLHGLGFRELRVRHHGSIARIEIPQGDFSTLLEHREEIVERLKEVGYIYVTIDLEGVRSGRLNEELPTA